MSPRNYLFIHQNMPGQFMHLVMHLRDRGHNVFFITKNKTNRLSRVTNLVYTPAREVGKELHPYLRSTEEGILNGQGVFRGIQRLQRELNFKPDVVVGHSGWGETMFVKDALPDVPVLNYFEFYYNAKGSDLGFDPEYPTNIDSQLSVRVKNTIAHLAASGCDWGFTPTQWQYSTYPTALQSRMSVMHEGVDTQAIKPDPKAVFVTESGKELRAGQKVVTFVARNLEPYRGFHTFMRAIPRIQRLQPDAEILIVGNDGVSYGQKLPEGDSYKKRMLAEVDFDRSKVHFTGHLQPPQFRAAMNVSLAHIYLTYPFILSWSLVEAMANGCLIIGSKTPPVEEVITDGENGLLVDFFDHAALADRVSEALSRPEKFFALRDAARRVAATQFDLRSVCLPRQLGLIDSFIARR
ncbi:glycosyltransferase family 4 protein [Lichenibacterium ramalinae]|uniref:Glycosyltransferase n=1 Tax=Lichenibacterium ramalinae TaxID=2316527 RepID=A0A4Q2R726_9HYPH|nr:glycosyltransferase family 4 protein [Lichenibacterium ramalinae]RYB02194.1 glycosyltransferase [Lichenibacterium ramalinae]